MFESSIFANLVSFRLVSASLLPVSRRPMRYLRGVAAVLFIIRPISNIPKLLMKPFPLVDRSSQRSIFHSASPQGRSRKDISLKNCSQLPLPPAPKSPMRLQEVAKTPRFVRNCSANKAQGCRLFRKAHKVDGKDPRETYLPLDNNHPIDNQTKIKHLLSVCSHLLPALKP